MNDSTKEMSQWYALRVTYRRELAVKSNFDERGIESYVPMHWEEKIVAGRKRKIWAPAIHNLIFVRTTDQEMKRIKAQDTLPICYIMNRATNSPAVIPEKQMNDFITVVAAGGEIETPATLDSSGLCRGDAVEVTDGPFKGIEGRCICDKGRTRIAVALDQIATALTAYIPKKYLKKI